MENEKIINESAPTEPVKAKAEAVSDNNINIDPPDVSAWQKFKERKPLFNILRAIFIFICTVLVAFSLILFILYAVPVLSEISPRNKSGITSNQDLKKSAAYKKQIGLMSKDIQRLSLKYNAYTSGQSYIVINTTENRFFLYTNKKLVREGFCSTGSLTMLKTEKGDKFWVFKTPKGKRSIHGKITNPSWNRPDWSFIEEGLPIPPKNSPARYESGVLGDYAMSIGDGYLIHGTIYKRFLGMPVTHGCVRLNDEDLKAVYNTLNIGSKVYIF
jgi:hypothetical protein